MVSSTPVRHGKHGEVLTSILFMSTPQLGGVEGKGHSSKGATPSAPAAVAVDEGKGSRSMSSEVGPGTMVGILVAGFTGMPSRCNSFSM